MAADEDTDLNDVIKEEQSRGRRTLDMKTRRERQQLLRDLRRLLNSGDERGFLQAMRSVGLKDGSPEFLEAWRVWRETQRR